MLRIEYLPKAKQDLSDIVRYIATTLDAPKAAHDLLASMEAAILLAAAYPNMYKVYGPTRGLSHPYHFIPVKNYAVFYVVFEDKIEVRRIVYAKMNLDALDLPAE